MNKKILLLLFLTTLTCSSKTEKPIPEKRLEGWAGNPDNPNVKPFDYYYMSHAARASKNSIDEKNTELMKTTCIDSVFTNLKRKFIEFMLEDNFYPNSFCKSILEKDSIYYSQKEVIYYLNPVNDIHLINATDWECSKSLKSIMIEYSERQIKEVKVKECKPLYLDDSGISGSGWKECECIVYAHIPGGRDAVIARAKRD